MDFFAQKLKTLVSTKFNNFKRKVINKKKEIAKVRKYWIINFMIILSILIMGGCNNEPSEADVENQASEADVQKEDKTLLIGVSPATIEVAEAIMPVYEEMGYSVKIEAFDDFVAPNNALVEGQVVANFYQHEPYLDAYNSSQGTDLLFTEKLAFSPYGLYSNKYEDVEEIPDNARIAINQDASNQDRGLKILEEEGLLTLPAEGSGEEGLLTILDIENNPKNIELVTMDINQLVHGIDELDGVISPAINFFQANVEPEYTLAKETQESDAIIYSIGLVINAEDADQQWVKDFNTLSESDTAKQLLEEKLGESYIMVDN